MVQIGFEGNIGSHVDVEWLDSSFDFPRIIPSNVTFGGGYCRAPLIDGYSYYRIFCAFDMCNDFGTFIRLTAI